MSEDRRRSAKGRKRLHQEVEEETNDLASGSESGETQDSQLPVDGRKRKKDKDKVKEKKKKRERSERVDTSEAPFSPKKETESEQDFERRYKLDNYSPFQLFCDFILKKFYKKDREEYFTHPVNPSDAPDYFTIITNPMDYSTIRAKIDTNNYNHLFDLKNDFSLIANNAMTYNKPNTIYYIAAQKLHNLIRYYFSPSYVEFLKYSLPFGNNVIHDVLGLIPKVPIKPKVTKPNQRLLLMREAVGDDEQTKNILASNPKKLRERLTEKKPAWNVGYLDKNDQGTVLNLVGGHEKTSICLADTIGRLDKGVSSYLSDYNVNIPAEQTISFTSYGPFATFAPHYDSTWSSLSKKECDLLLSTYGDRSNVTDVVALRTLAADSSKNLVKVVDSLLDTLTEGEHSRALAQLELEEEKDENQKLSIKDLLDDVDSLTNLGVDVSFIKSIKKDLGIIEKPQNLNQRLNQAGQMITDLNNLQTQRLNQPPSGNLNHANVPGQVERDLGNNVVNHLANTVKAENVNPNQLTSTPQVHQAMGVNPSDDLDLDIFAEFMVVG